VPDFALTIASWVIAKLARRARGFIAALDRDLQIRVLQEALWAFLTFCLLTTDVEFIFSGYLASKNQAGIEIYPALKFNLGIHRYLLNGICLAQSRSQNVSRPNQAMREYC
jgi:hypothetical protein